jgi:transcription initiation factor TFIIA small subunit
MPPKKRSSAATDASTSSTGKGGSKKPRVTSDASVAAAQPVVAVPGGAAKAAFVPKAFVKLYRTTPVGKALTESLDELLQADKLDEETALQILNQFDASMFFALRAKARTDLQFSGHLEEYRLVDNVWTWLLTNVSLTFGERTVRTARLKVVAMKAYEQNE